MSTQPLVKKTTSRGIACPVFRDEEGFLSEFVAYYQLHGLNHIRFYDDGSIDNSLVELAPWITSGFVSVVANASRLLSEIMTKKNEKNKKWSKMLQKTGLRNTIQRVSESDCKQYAMRYNYDFYFSLDVDEYMLPAAEGVTLMDAVSKTSDITAQSIYSISKYSFAATPHLLEPVNMLTIEAYKVRMLYSDKLTYFKSVSPKLILHLSHPNITKRQKRFMLNCCNFHNCYDVNCRHFHSIETEYLYKGNGNIESIDNQDTIMIFHYSRSLEKFTHKQKTWQKIGDNNFTITNFLDRNIGTIFDNRASERYASQVRQILQHMTHDSMPHDSMTHDGMTRAQTGNEYVRPGHFWRLKTHQNTGHMSDII
jgi:hypothetical protein